MKRDNVREVYLALEKWHRGEGQIYEVCRLLGDDNIEVANMLCHNGYCNLDYTPVGGFTFQEIVNAVLLYIGMRIATRRLKT